MTGHAGSAAALCAGLVLSATLVLRLGFGPAMPVALVSALLLLALLLRGLGRLARILLALLAAVLAAALISGRAEGLDLGPALFAFAFVLATGLLREIALRDPSFRRLGETLVELRGAWRYPVVSLAVGVAGLALLIGALQFLAGLVTERGARRGDRRRIGTLRADLAGYVLIPLLSPLAIPFIVVSSLVPGLDWYETLPTLLAVAVAVWGAALLQDRLAGPGHADGTSSLREIDPRVVPKALAPVALAALLHWGAGLRLSDSAMLAIVLVALVWAALLPDGGAVLKDGATASGNEAAIIGASIATGLVLLALVPGVGAALPLAFLPAPLLPPLFLAAFVLPGLVGVQPALCFMMLTPALSTLAAADPGGLAPILAAIIAGWALNSITSPFGLPILIVARAGQVAPLRFLARENAVVTIGAPLAAALILALAAG